MVLGALDANLNPIDQNVVKHEPANDVPGNSVAVAKPADENDSTCNKAQNDDISRRARRSDEGSSSEKQTLLDKRAFSAMPQGSKRRRKVLVYMPF